MVVVFDDRSVRIAARIGRVVIGPTVVDRPVRELQVRVRPKRIQVEEIDQVKFPDAELDPPRRKRSGEMKLVSFGFDLLVAQRDDLSEYEPRQIGIL